MWLALREVPSKDSVMSDHLTDGSKYIELSVQEVGREQCIPEKDFSFTPKKYDLLHYVYAGKGTFIHDGVEAKLKAYDIFFIPKGTTPHYTPDKSDPWSYLWVGFGGANASSLLKQAGIDGDNPIHQDKKQIIKPLFKELYDSYLRAGKVDLGVLGKGYSLMDALIKNAAISKNVHHNTSPHVLSAKQFITNNYQYSITLDDVASSVGVTPNYLCNLFKDSGEVSPKAFLIKLRMEKAASLLLGGAMSVGEVSEAVGYSSPVRFSIVFNQYYGVAPRDFAKKNRI